MSLNDFIFGKVLGKGSFGTVNIVTRKQDNKIYAMKRVNINNLSDKDKRSSLNEIRILASLNHPNIISYKEAFFDEETRTLNIVMEYAEEGDLENKVKENLKHRLRFKEETIWEWLIQILEGLKYLHDNKIMHRDLKCANIFITKNGILKLGDLNVSIIAKMGMAKTQTGTPYYCSPEIWNDRPYDYKSDIWSVGCIIYELCQLRPPFRGTNLRDLCRNVIRGYYLPISSYYSNELRQMISMMLIVDANKRAGTDELLQHPILQKKLQRVRKNIITREIKIGKSKKVQLMETIKLPRNLKDINSKLPKKRYRQENEMMANDEYETMKATFFQEQKKQFGNNNLNNNFNNNLNQENFKNNFYYNENNINNRQLINNYIRKNEQQNIKNNNNLNNNNNDRNNNKMNNYQPYDNNNYNKHNKYAYLNIYNNNMELKKDNEEKKDNNNKYNYNGKNYNYHYKDQSNNYNFEYQYNKNKNLENNYNNDNDRNNNKDLINYENNQYRMQNDNICKENNNSNINNNDKINDLYKYNGNMNNNYKLNLDNNKKKTFL